MNKIRLIKIYELRGKIHPMEAFIIDILNGIEEVPNSIFIDYKKEDKRYFYQDLINDNFWLSYLLVWIFFETKFKCNYYETQEVTKYLLEKHLNKRVTKTNLSYNQIW